MKRPTLFWLPRLACAGLALASFSACGGVSPGDLFSSSGGAPSAGSTSSAGEPGEAGAKATAGEAAGGASAAGGSSESGASSGGTSAEAGAATGGASLGGGTATAGESAGGASAGSGQAGGDPAGGAGSGGASNEPTCPELNARATKELAAAQACNVAADAKQCTGKVDNTCGCEVPVQRGDSAETKTYEATLKEIEKKGCKQICPALACVPVNFAQCKANGGSVAGTCTSYGFQQ